MPAEFDRFAGNYDDLLRDPLRDRFAPHLESFARRKSDVLRILLARAGRDSRHLSLLDIGCGRGEFLRLASPHFAAVSGCDPSAEMLAHTSASTRRQPDPLQLPYDDASFDVATLICVLHHVVPAERPQLLAEARRVLRPAGCLGVFEHNPWNPATRLIVRRSPIDRDAQLLTAPHARQLLAAAGFAVRQQRYFLYFPEPLYRRAPGLENALTRLPLGGQYALLAVKS